MDVKTAFLNGILKEEVYVGQPHVYALDKALYAPRYVGPFEITKMISPVAYRLRLPEELNNVHDAFHVSNLKKCLADPTLHVPLEEIQVDAKLNFVEEPVEKNLSGEELLSSRFDGIRNEVLNIHGNVRIR
nr:reverse transcriptase domain-containing protein [Tanacetum cinerariifolium]